MKFKIQKILTNKQLWKAKVSIFLAVSVTCVQMLAYVLGGDQVDQDGNSIDENGNIVKFKKNDNGKYEYTKDGATAVEYLSHDIMNFPRGRIVRYGNNEGGICDSPLLIPGIQILPVPLLAVFYCLTLIYLFLGVSIIADLFMAGIEKITSQTQTIDIKDANGQVIRKRKVLIWNATIANLSLMALGSSAPEILLAVIETLKNLGKCPGELGASTIVGSAAFNLLVISGLSIMAVNEKNDTDPRRDESLPVGVKKIADMGVFSITATSSIWAYVWLLIVLRDQNVSIVEAWITLLSFFVLLIICYCADRYKQGQDEKARIASGEGEEKMEVYEFSAMEIYRTLINEKQGIKPESEEEAAKIQRMKGFLKDTMKTDQIDKVDLDALKKEIGGDGLISRMKYRREVQNQFTGKRPAIAKGEIMKAEHAHAEFLDEKLKNDRFGFNCLHYSVSEASGSLQVMILNKTQAASSVRVVTVDAEAKAGEDFQKVDTTLRFAQGEKQKFIEVVIHDDDNWEPDEDFFVQLLNPDTGEELAGQDCRTRITIIDDDKPGQICFQEPKAIQALASDKFADIVIDRKNGSDGIVTVDYITLELDESEHTATAGKDFEHVKGTLEFKQGETEKTITVPIIQKDDDQPRDESFAVQLANVTPAGAKLSKKSFMIVNIVTDVESKRKQDALAQLLAKIEEEEEITWRQQFINACMKHPTKNEDGDIVDVDAMDGFLHFVCIGWKLLFSVVPPPHYAHGWACFGAAITLIGGVTYVIGEFAGLFGCVLGIKPSVTAITFVALGTSLPDTFASMQAAVQDVNADPALGNVTGSNAVNVFLGLGLPWVIASHSDTNKYKGNPDYGPYEGYYVPAGALGFSVVLFSSLAVVCVIFLLGRRFIVGGELGGTQFGRAGSCTFLVILWLVYIVCSTLQAYGKIPDIEGLIDKSIKHRDYPVCNYDIKKT